MVAAVGRASRARPYCTYRVIALLMNSSTETNSLLIVTRSARGFIFCAITASGTGDLILLDMT